MIPRCRPLLVLLLLLVLPRPARAVEITAFLSGAAPSANWNTGWGATLTTTWFKVLALEGEFASQPTSIPSASLTSFTFDALIAPPIGIFTPYGGLGFGGYHESTASNGDTGVIHALILGGKVKLGGLFILKAEYRRMEIQSIYPLQHRISGGAGVSF
jgi:hypothetical protein